MKIEMPKHYHSGWKRRICLVLIFTMLFSTFMYQGWYEPKFSDAAAVANGTIYYGNSAATPVNRAYTASINLFGAQGNTTAGGAQGFMQIKSSTVNNTKTAGYTTAAGQLYIENFDGTTWSAGFTVSVGAVTGSQRRFDIAYERASGRALVVYTKNTAGPNNLAYRVWNGASWSAETTFTAARLTRAVQWVKMASRRGGNEIAVAVADLGSTTANKAELTTLIWDGSAWGNEPVAALSTTLYSAATSGVIKSDEFDLAYESVSGKLLVVWLQAVTSGGYYITYSAGQWGTVTWYNNSTGGPASIMAKPNPETNDILVLNDLNGLSTLYGYVWNGSGMVKAGTCGSTQSAATDQRQFTGGWVKFNTTWYALAIFNTGASNTIGYNYWNGTTWGTATTTPSVAATAKYWLQSDDDPKGQDSMLVAFSDSVADLYAKRVQITDATPTFTWTGTVSPDAALTSTLTSTTTQNFAFTYDYTDITPPATSWLTFDSPVYAAYVGSPFTFHGYFTDSESGVTSCEICVKNGSECSNTDTWIAGALTGTAAPWICTATNVTTYSNGGDIAGGDSVYIDVRGTSAGGTNVDGGTAIFKTMDKTPPADVAVFTTTPGTDQNALSWAAASDTGGSGLAGYDVRALPGTTPPADCSAGTSIYTGAGTSYTHSVTPYASGYSYRVCAIDNVSNTSTGRTGSGLPIWSATITSCGGCHGYTSSFTDGIARNNPAGTFVGNHNAHAVKVGTACSICHVVPATNGHSNGKIEMQATIKNGSYSKVSPFDQTNNPTTGRCSNITCHGANNPTPTWGVGTAGCVDCHRGAVAAANASILSSGTVTRRDNVVSEFSLAWGHKKYGRGTVANADCIVCHLEGNYSTQKTSVLHGDGRVDLRDPDGAGETAISDMNGGTFLFTKFTTTYAAGSRTSSGHTSNNVDNVLTQKFCLACHDGNGATNPTARAAVGAQYMPWGGINLGLNYTVANGAAVAGGVVDVYSQLATTNSSYHPVRGPLYRDFPAASRLVAPYNSNGNRAGTSGTKTLSVVLNCFDCHNLPTPLSNRTIVSHGSNTTLRGDVFVNPVTLCNVCHSGYNTAQAIQTVMHDTGSAYPGSASDGYVLMQGYMQNQCYYCHASANAPVRPVRAQDYHGFNRLAGSGTDALWPAGATETSRPYGFIRNTTTFTNQRPLAAPDLPEALKGTCAKGTASSCQTMGDYSPAGSY